MLPAILTIAGSLGASAFNYWNQRRSERLQERLANSAVTRRMEDLRRAGINPILAAQGQGAGGVSVQPVRFENPLEQFSDNLATAQRVENENQLVEEQRDKLKADTEVSKKQIDVMRESILSSQLNRTATQITNRLNSAKADQEEVWAMVYRMVGNTLDKYLGAKSRSATVESAASRVLKALGFTVDEDSPAGQLWKWLSTKEEQAERKVEPWQLKSHKEVPTTFRDIRKER